MATLITNIDEALHYNVEEVEVDEYWNLGENPEHAIHRIHAYPAKFPAFIATKAIEYAKDHSLEIKKIADIFCGCGTVALESKNNNIDFWGCDINPIATLIAKVKSNTYNYKTMERYYLDVLDRFNKIKIDDNEYESANERLQYWFDQKHYCDLKRLLSSIEDLPRGKYEQAYKCIFSAILKSTSKWLSKSIKPQIDPGKNPIDVEDAFKIQYAKFLRALQSESVNSTSHVTIETQNFLTKRTLPKVSMIITSPPYVTSYEYADLHQLSSLWLGYATDYRTLRNGTIGSIHNSDKYYFELMDLNQTGQSIIAQMREQNIETSKIKSVARYYIDIQRAVSKCYDMLYDKGIAFFIIGDTEYKGVKIYNSKHLCESLILSGFAKVEVSKRKISKKILTPYRDESGRFTTDKNKREVYHEEFVIIGFKENIKDKEERL